MQLNSPDGLQAKSKVTVRRIRHPIDLADVANTANGRLRDRRQVVTQGRCRT